MKSQTIFIVFFILSSTFCKSQVIDEKDKPSISDSSKEIYSTGLDTIAQFPGGALAWKKFLQKNLNLNVPDKYGAPDGNYPVVVKFIVAIDGSLSNFVPQTTFGYGMEDEVIRVIKKGPKWEPAIWQGRKVNSYRKQEIAFVIASK